MIATYRLQVHPGFTFADVKDLIPYLVKLGISHLYLSPVMEAGAGSTHGYDVVDHNEVRHELGGRAGFEELREAAVEAGLGLIVDFVPNHAGVGPNNATWQEMLAYGPQASGAHYFDIDWSPLKPELQGKILLPFLGNTYGEVLDNGEITLTYSHGRLFATYYDNSFALNPGTYDRILESLLPRFERNDSYWQLKDLYEAYEQLDPHMRDRAEALRPRLEQVAEKIDIENELGDALDQVELHRLLDDQYWRLAFWKTAGSEVNYRRFFDINELVALRMEDESVFWDAHRLLGELLAEEGVDGVRIDHIDGLYDPHHYLDLLRDAGAERIWVEKILAPGETLPEAWPVVGATGYAFLNDAMGVLLDPDGEEPMSRIYRRFVPHLVDFSDEVYRSKQHVMHQSLTSERLRLAYELDRLSEIDYHTRDFTLEALQRALTNVIACFDRYRTYLPHSPQDATAELIREIIHKAKQRNPADESTVYDFIGDVIIGNVDPKLEHARRAWIGRLQQYTAPVAAKGVEDTAFYRYHRLSALNEVGGEPDEFGISDHAFHSRSQFRAKKYPHHLLATATHDHKRGEGTRMRLLALAEEPERWAETLDLLEEIAESHSTDTSVARSDLYLFFQVLVALWPETSRDELADRLWHYMQKAAREAKLNTTWGQPSETYEEALRHVVEGTISDDRLDQISEFADRIAHLGFRNSLSQLLLKTTTGGIPDFYQGTELLDLSLVDPDNRRPVDYGLRRQLIDGIQPYLKRPEEAPLQQWLEADDPILKQYFTARLLQIRKEHPPLFSSGTHEALDVEGPGADGWIAYVRKTADASVIVACSRYPASASAGADARISLASDSAEELISGTTIDAEENMINLTDLPLPWAVLSPSA